MSITYRFGTNRPEPALNTTNNTTCHFGMNQTEANDYYSGTTLDGLVKIEGYGHQRFEIQYSGLYDLEVAGAQGGCSAATYGENRHLVR